VHNPSRQAPVPAHIMAHSPAPALLGSTPDGSAATHSWPGRPPFVACRQRGGVRSSSSVPTRPAQPRKQEGNEEHAAVDAIVQCRAVYFRLHMYGFLRSVGEVASKLLEVTQQSHLLVWRACVPQECDINPFCSNLERVRFRS